MTEFWRQWWNYLVLCLWVGGGFLIVGLVFPNVLLPVLAWFGDRTAQEMLSNFDRTESAITAVGLSASGFLFFLILFSGIHLVGNALAWLKRKRD